MSNKVKLDELISNLEMRHAECGATAAKRDLECWNSRLSQPKNVASFSGIVGCTATVVGGLLMLPDFSFLLMMGCFLLGSSLTAVGLIVLDPSVIRIINDKKAQQGHLNDKEAQQGHLNKEVNSSIVARTEQIKQEILNDVILIANTFRVGTETEPLKSKYLGMTKEKLTEKLTSLSKALDSGYKELMLNVAGACFSKRLRKRSYLAFLERFVEEEEEAALSFFCSENGIDAASVRAFSNYSYKDLKYGLEEVKDKLYDLEAKKFLIEYRLSQIEENNAGCGNALTTGKDNRSELTPGANPKVPSHPPLARVMK